MQNLDMRVHDTGFSSSGSIPAHRHAGTGLFEFHYFLQGEGTFRNAGVASSVKPGTLFLSQPDDWRSALVPQPGRFLFYYLLFTVDEDPDGLLGGLTERFLDKTGIPVGRTHAPTFEDIRRRCASPDALTRRSADFRFLALLCDLAGNRPPAAQPVRYVEEALALMQESIHTALDLDQVARKLGIDKSYFVRLFKRTVGVPPMRYFLGLRLDSAKHRLRNGDEGLRAIALDLGFHDEFHFSHQFKTHVGESPHAYRQSSG
jgi:AraC-like DNA-binding protein